MVISRVGLRRREWCCGGGGKMDLTWAGVPVVGKAWEETRAAKAAARRVREKSILLALDVDVRKVGLLLRI